MEVKERDKWVISLLLAALSAVLWYLLLDTRAELQKLQDKIVEHSIALATCKK